MADKEERISIQSFKYNPCENCDEYCYCKKHDIKCVLGKDYNNGMTRQKAIEVMAKEIYKRRWIESECKNKNTLGFSICKGYAEIALNALLEGGK